jgi:hypothetical protein
MAEYLAVAQASRWLTDAVRYLLSHKASKCGLKRCAIVKAHNTLETSNIQSIMPKHCAAASNSANTQIKLKGFVLI